MVYIKPTNDKENTDMEELLTLLQSYIQLVTGRKTKYSDTFIFALYFTLSRITKSGAKEYEKLFKKKGEKYIYNEKIVNELKEEINQKRKEMMKELLREEL